MSQNLGSTPNISGVDFHDASVALSFLGEQRDEGLKPLALARPKNESAVQAVVQWANEQNLALLPLSSPGGHRRRGSTGLGTQPFVVLDLSGLSRVIHADYDDGIAIIEPGVTFAEFDIQLKSKNLRSIKPFLPRQTKSVLSCFLEREPTTIPNEHWDSTDPLASLSLVMGNGEAFRTGGAALYEDLDEGLKNGARQMMSIGPLGTDYTRVVMGSQGTLAVACWASIYCERIPKIEKGHLYGSDDLGAVLALVRHLSLHQLGSQYFVLSKTQLAAALAENASDFSLLMDELNRKGLPSWCLYVNIASREVMPEESMSWQLADLAECVSSLPIDLISDKETEILSRFESRLHSPTERFYKDVPTGAHTDVFCISKLSNVSKLIGLINEVLSAAPDIQSGVYLQPMIQGTNCHIDITLFHSKAEQDVVVKLEQQLVTVLADNGGFFSRPYGSWSEAAFGKDKTIVPHLQKVKHIFDPAGVLSPGKLCY